MPGSQKTPTIYDVAKRAGVSIATVSRMLNAPDKVSHESRERIMEAIDALGFVPKAEARARALSLTSRIGVVTPFFTAPSFVQRLRGIAAALSSENYELVIYTVDSLNRMGEYLSSIPFTGNLDGIILVSLPVDEKEVQRLLDHGLQVVLIEFSHPDLNCIEINDFHGGEMAANHLIRKGHRQVAFIGDIEPQDFSIHPTRSRLAGYQKALQEAGLGLSEEYIRLVTNDSEHVMQAARTLLNLPNPPTAIFAAADLQALSIIKEARELGVEIPTQLAVVGFDDIDFAEYADLTTIRQHLDESGRLAVEILLAHIVDPNRPPQHVNLPLVFVQRQTT